MKRMFTFLAVCLLVSGCMSAGVKVTQQDATQFKEGVTTEAEIISKLGLPTSTMVSSGVKMLIYGGYQSQATPASYIPIVGLFAGGADFTSASAMFEIDAVGVLKKATFTETSNNTRMGIRQPEPPPKKQ